MREALFYLIPALLLLATLALGRYPGERLRLALGRRAGRGSRFVVTPPPRRPFPFVTLPRGGALLAMSRAGRAPPVPRQSRLWARTV
jgi:hypothetical protein